MFSIFYRINLKCPISDWLLPLRALTICSDRFPPCHYCYISIIALFKHYLLIDLNGSHPLCCTVASMKTKKRQRGANCIRPASRIWHCCGDRKSSSFIIRCERCKIRTCSFVVFGLEGQMCPSDRVHWIWRETLKTSITGTVMVQYLLYVSCTKLFIGVWIGVGYDATHLWTDDWALLHQDWQAVCFHVASHDWTMIDGQSITQEAPLAHQSAQPQTLRTGSVPLRDQFLSCQSFLLMDSARAHTALLTGCWCCQSFICPMNY